MSKLNGRKVSVARLHGSTNIKGIGNVGPVISDVSTAKLKTSGLSMQYLDGQLAFLSKDKVVAIIPIANVVSMELEPENSSKS